MASGKRRRKEAKAAKKQQAPAGPFRHPDGDRRHRGAQRVEDAIKDKEMLRLIGAVDLPEEEDEEWDEAEG